MNSDDQLEQARIQFDIKTLETLGKLPPTAYRRYSITIEENMIEARGYVDISETTSILHRYLWDLKGRYHGHSEKKIDSGRV